MKHIISLFKEKIKGIRRKLIFRNILSNAGVKAITEKQALIIAPHPDDETFGCGGLIALKRELGVQVHIVFLTSGESSHRKCCDINPEKIGLARQRQTAEAAKSLGLNESSLYSLKLADGDIPRFGYKGFDAAVTKLTDLFNTLSPQEVYCPHPLDCWADHEAASEITWEALHRYERECDLFYYLIWGWYNLPLHLWTKLRLNRSQRLNIRSVSAKKLKAINSYLNTSSAPCGNPYCGKLPKGFLNPFLKKDEIFFHDKSF